MSLIKECQAKAMHCDGEYSVSENEIKAMVNIVLDQCIKKTNLVLKGRCNYDWGDCVDEVVKELESLRQ